MIILDAINTGTGHPSYLLNEEAANKLDEVFGLYDRMKSRFDELYYKMNPSEEDELECRILGNMLGKF